MAFDTDPYRALGLTRGASLDEVKRAYRRLAKANHPDAAGAGALSRFLAIQAAYEQLAGGSKGPGAKARRPAASTPRPSEADPERADATRRAYGGRPRGRRRASDEEAGQPRTPGGPAGSETSGPRGKATLGSTSYDGADTGPFEPDWGGASWYGTSSGTYWTINPKEYADPRKHGPEYQARARRASTTRPRAGAKTQEVPDATEPDPETPEATAAGTPQAAERPMREGPAPGQAGAADLGRALTDPPSGGLPNRIVRALAERLRNR
jgi:curved DNA-binding protein CbpA